MANEQMFFDRDSDSFLAEVGQILKITEIHIDIAEAGWLRLEGEASVSEEGTYLPLKYSANPKGPTFKLPNPEKVKVSFAGREPTSGELIRIVELGRSYGEALAKVREEIRKETGR